jgi:hypothetical protein
MEKILLIVFAAFLIGCSAQPSENQTNEDVLIFPIKDFIEVKTKDLTGKNLKKKSRINGKEQVVEKILSEEDWLSELDIFIRSDIDNPTLRGSFNTTQSENFLVHELKPGEKSKVKKITVRYSMGKVMDISVFLKEDNLFYDSEMRGNVYFNEKTGDLSHFIVYGTQEVMFLSTNKLYVEGVIQ